MKQPSSGFTLVELAIVIVVVGLLIGGLLQFQSIIEAARVKGVIGQIKSYTAAANIYRDKYNSLPGDDGTAVARVPGCTALNNCINGNGDGIIGTPTTNYSHNNQSGSNALPAVETTMFWKHLTLADLIGGLEPASSPTSPAWGSTHPKSRGDGGFHVLYANETSITEPVIGHYFILRAPPTGDPHPTSPGLGAVSPNVALEIDRKMDDGNGKTGHVKADSASNICSSGATGAYMTPDTSPNCVMIFRFN